MSGPEFSDLRPVANGVYAPLRTGAFSFGGLNNGTIYPVRAPGTSPDSFREGETLLIYLEVWFPLAQDVGVNPDMVYVSGIRIKEWWLRSAVEHRTPGDARQSGNPTDLLGGLIPNVPPTTGTVPCPSQIDHENFLGWSIADQPFDQSAQFAIVNTNTPLGAPPGGRTLGNRGLWIPSAKRLDVLPAALGSAPLNFSTGNNSDSVLLDSVWLCPLPNPNSAPWNAPPWNTVPVGSYFPPGFRVNKVFPAAVLGRALGVSFEVLLARLSDNSPFIPAGIPTAPNSVYPLVSIGYRAGSTHAVNQGRVG